MISGAKPNPGHQALAELEKAGNLATVITQNIDELHQQAGSQSVIELHGTTKSYYCLSCSKRFDFDTVYAMAEKANPPPCSDCQGMIRPDVVFFGESLKTDVLRSAFEKAQQCDFILAVGSSLVVYPAADIPVQAKRAGAKLVIINKDPTPLDSAADYVLREASGEVLPKVVQYMKEA
jgi:NAD-dependent deacetylase